MALASFFVDPPTDDGGCCSASCGIGERASVSSIAATAMLFTLELVQLVIQILIAVYDYYGNALPLTHSFIEALRGFTGSDGVCVSVGSTQAKVCEAPTREPSLHEVLYASGPFDFVVGFFVPILAALALGLLVQNFVAACRNALLRSSRVAVDLDALLVQLSETRQELEELRAQVDAHEGDDDDASYVELKAALSAAEHAYSQTKLAFNAGRRRKEAASKSCKERKSIAAWAGSLKKRVKSRARGAVIHRATVVSPPLPKASPRTSLIGREYNLPVEQSVSIEDCSVRLARGNKRTSWASSTEMISTSI